MTLIVGFGHKAQQGKTTLAEMIHCLAPAETKVYNFSDTIVARARSLGLMGSKKNSPLLQDLGAFYRKHISLNYWITELDYSIKGDDKKIALVTGVRFTNEFDWIQANGGICVDVIRQTLSGAQWISPDRPATHLSEVELDGARWDYTLSAKDGDFGELQKNAKALWQLVGLRL